MRRTILCLALLCLSGCGVTSVRQAHDQARTDVSACQGTYPLAKGSLTSLLRCEDAADMAYARWLAPAETAVFARYADAVERRAMDVDRGRLSIRAFRTLVREKRTALARTQDSRATSLFAMLPAAAIEDASS